MEHWSVEDYKNYENSKKPKKAKYRSYKTSVDGHTFDSVKEAQYYQDLKRLIGGRKIEAIIVDPSAANFCQCIRYHNKYKVKADFITFNNDGTYDVIDVKGFKTKEYIAKKKVFEDKYNLKITEIE